jgi:chromosome partitioning protein
MLNIYPIGILCIILGDIELITPHIGVPMIIVLASRKGGSGKSTLACNLCSALAVNGRDVCLVDTDPQGTAGNWAQQRAGVDSVNQVSFIPAKPGKNLLKTLQDLRKRFQYVVLDLQGVDSEDNRYTLAMADRLLIPFKPSQPDLDTIPWAKKLLDQLLVLNPEVKVHLFINEAPITTGFREVKEAIAYFENFDLKASPTVIHARKVYRDSMSSGLGAMELKDEKARDEIQKLYQEVILNGQG